MGSKPACNPKNFVQLQDALSDVTSLFAVVFKGNMYTTGEAGKVDLAKAAEYFTKAAEKGAVHALL